MPGVSCRCIVAARAVSVRRGSTTMRCPPAPFCSKIHCMMGGIVSAQFDPQSIRAFAFAMSETGNGRPRSMPKARFWPAAAEAMQ